MGTARILVIDDNLLMVNLIESVLETEGYQIESAGSAAQGLAAIERHRPDLILMDLNLPDGDGITLTRQLRKDPNLPGLKILIFSGSEPLGGDVEGWLALGFDGHLPKPFNVKVAVELMRQHLQV